MNQRTVIFLILCGMVTWATFGGTASAIEETSTVTSTLPEPVIVVGQKSGVEIVEKLSSEQLMKNWVHVKSAPPHRQLNPDHHVIDYEGIELKRLTAGLDTVRDRWIYFIGLDEYVSMVPAELVRNHRAVLAFRENGKALMKQRGGQQVVYPTEPDDQPVAEQYAKKAAFWAWYVKSIVIGSLPNSIMGSEKRADISVLASKASPVRITPLPTFSYEKHECPKVYGVTVDASFMERVHKPRSSIRFLSLTGKSIDVSPEDFKKGRYLLLATRGDTAFPVQCGGPFLLIKRDSIATQAGKDAGSGTHDYMPLIYGIEEAGK
jgi:hypothetical protein